MFKLYKGDCLVESKIIDRGSVDLIITDLPYGTVKNIAQTPGVSHGMKGKLFWDEVIDTKEVLKVANDVLRKNGKMILFAQQPFTTELINNALPNLPFCYNMIWEKDHFANALIAKKAPLNYYEDILVYSKLNPIHDLEFTHPLRPYFEKIFKLTGSTKKDIVARVGQGADHVFRFSSSQFSLCTRDTYDKLVRLYKIDKMPDFMDYESLVEIDSPYRLNLTAACNSINPSVFNLWEGFKFKSNILKYKKDYEGLHPTQKPVLLIEDLIKTFSNSGDIVLDLTMGSGSTGVACMNTGRKFIGIEKNDGYFEIAKNRIHNAFNLY